MRLALFLLAAAAFAETKMPLGMILPAGPTGCFVGLDTSGKFQCIPIPPPVIPARLYNVPAVPGGAGTFAWQLPSAPDPATLEVHRNGLLMKPALDYTVTGQTVTFSALQTSAIDDTILCSYVPR